VDGPPRLPLRPARAGRPGRAALAALAAALAAGCAPRVPPPDLSLEPAALLAQVRAAQASPRSVRGEARLSVKSASASGSAAELVAAERPDRLRLATLDFFGNPVAVLTARDGAFGLWDAKERVYYRGEATAENLARLLPLPIPAADLAVLLCGAAPIPDDARALRAEAGRGFVTLELEAGGALLRVRVGPGARVERFEREGPGGYAVRFERFGAAAGAASFPWAAALSSHDKTVSLDLSWEEVEVDVALDPGTFRLDPPRGARVVEAGNGAPPPPFEGLAPAPPRAP
jgi:hypothetical protein